MNKILMLLLFILSLSQAGTLSKPFITISHSSNISTVSYSPNGRNIISGSFDSTIKIWDVQSGKLLKTFNANVGRVIVAIYSPNGNNIACAGYTGTINILDSNTGKLLKTLYKNEDEIKSIIYSPDGKYLASRNMYGPKDDQGRYAHSYIEIWDTKSGKLIDSLGGFPSAMAYSPNGSFLAVGTLTGEVDIWDTKNWKLLNTYAGLEDKINRVVYSPSGRSLVINDEWGMLKILDSLTGKVLNSLDKGDLGRLDFMAYSPNGKYLSLGGSNIIYIFNVHAGKFYRKLVGNQDFGNINSIDYSPNGKYLVSGTQGHSLVGYDNEEMKIQIWDIKNEKVLKSFDGKVDKVLSITNSDDGRYIASSTGDAIKVWDIKNGKLLKSVEGHRRFINTVTYSQHGKHLYLGIGTISSGIKDDAVIFLDVENEKIIKTFKGHRFSVDTIVYSLNEKYLASGDRAGDINIWDMKNGNLLKNLEGFQSDNLLIAFSPNGKYIVSGNRENEIKIREIKSGKVLKKLTEYLEDVTAIEYSPDGRHLALSIGQSIKLLDSNNGKLFKEINTKSEKITSIAHSPDGKFLVSSNLDGTIKKWDVFSGKLLKVFERETGPISSIIYSKNGKQIISRSFDGKVNVWNVESGKKILTMVTHRNDWIAITSEGYFNGSKNAAKYLNITRTTKDGLEPFDFSQLYDHFFRPDLVKLKLAGEEEAYQKAINGMTYEEALKNPPPKLSFNTIDDNKAKTSGYSYDNVKTTKRNLALNFNIKQTETGGVGLVRIYQEGKLIQTIGEGKINRKVANEYSKLEQARKDKKQKVAQDKHITLAMNEQKPRSNKSTQPTERIVAKSNPSKLNNKEGDYNIDLELISGDNEICIEAFNKTNTVTSYKECVTIKADVEKREPRIYVIVAGVNEFDNPNRSNNLKYAENDAKAIRDAIKETQGKVYKEVITKELLGKDMTSKNILNAVKDVQKEARLEDTILFFISTHGVAEDTGLYFIAQNNKSDENDISFQELFQELQSIKSLNQIYIVDTCQSGEAADIVSSVYDSRASVFAKSSGVHMLLATTKGTSAFESQDPNVEHGVFTHKILQALKTKKSDKNKDNYISVIELSDVLKDPANNVEYQYPVIRNIGNDVNIEQIE